MKRVVEEVGARVVAVSETFLKGNSCPAKWDGWVWEGWNSKGGGMRGEGGRGWWIKEDIAARVHVLRHYSDCRRGWIKIDRNGVDLYVCGIYNYAGNYNENAKLIKKIKAEAVKMKGDVVLIGDFNARVGQKLGTIGEDRKNREGVELVEVAKELGLRLVLADPEVKDRQGITRIPQYTRRGVASGGKISESIIDHILVSGEVKVLWAEVLDEDVLSDHRPIATKVVGRTKTGKKKEVKEERWIFAKKDKDKYESAVEGEMREFEERTKDMTVEEIWREMKSGLFKATEDTFKRIRVEGGVRRWEWWNEECERWRKVKNAEWRKWRSTKDEGAQLRFTQAKKELKRSIKEARREAWRCAVDKVCSKSRLEPREYWSGIKRLLPKGSRLPLWWNNKEEWTDDPEVVVDKWASYWEDLCKEVKVDEGRKEMIETDIKKWLEEDKKDDSEDITIEEVRLAREEMKLNSPGYDRIAPQMVKWGGGRMDNVLCYLFNKCRSENKTPSDWDLSLIRPLPKFDGAVNPEDTRGISLLSVISKMWERIILRRLQKKMVADDVEVRDEQGAYRKGMGPEFWVWRLHEEMRKRKKFVVVLIDLVKAFDRVWRQAVVWKLKMMGASGAEWRAVAGLYKQLYGAVKIDGWTSKFVNLAAGIKQGGVISPWLFVVFINDLVEELVKVGCGSYDECRDIVTLLFADDVALVESSIERAQKLVDVIARWADRWGMGLAAPKCLVITNIPVGEIRVGETTFKRVKNARYLGVIISEDCKWKDQEKFVLDKVRSRVRDLVRTGLVVKEMGVVDGLRLWDALVHPVAYWAVGAWQPSKGWAEKMNRIKRRFARGLLGVAASTPNAAVEGETGMMKANEDITLRRLLFWDRLRRCESKIIKTQVNEIESTELWKYVKEEQWELWLGDEKMTKLEWKAAVKKEVRRKAQIKWRQEVESVSKLEWYSKIKKSLVMESYLDDCAVGDKVAIAQLRTGGGTLLEEVGRRWPTIPKENRLCPICGDGVETATHVVADCVKYAEERREAWEGLCEELNRIWLVRMYGKLNMGLAEGGNTSPLVAILKRMSPQERATALVSGGLTIGVFEDERAAMWRWGSRLMGSSLRKRMKMIKNGEGNELAARVAQGWVKKEGVKRKRSTKS